MVDPFASLMHIPQQQFLMPAYTNMAGWGSFRPVMVPGAAAGSATQQPTEPSMSQILNMMTVFG